MKSIDNRLTTNAGESSIQLLLGNDAMFEIPFFQRPYKWEPDRLNQLNGDLQSLVDEENDVHFLGAVIVHGRHSDPSDPSVYEVIDGQQRLTTLYLHLCAVVRSLVELEQIDEAVRMFRRYLVTNTRLTGKSNLTLHPSREDRADLNEVIQDLLKFKNFESHLEGFTFYSLAGGGPTNGRIAKNYKLIRRHYQAIGQKENGLDSIKKHYAALLQKISIVQIDVKDPTNGPKIFDSLNSRQHPMTVGDLVRNDIFTRLATSDPDLAVQLEEGHWQPFYEAFRDQESNKSLFDKYFFPYGLVHNPNLKKSDAYLEIRSRWVDRQPKEIITELSEYQAPFLDLMRGTNTVGHSKRVAEGFRKLYDSNTPSSALPFLMRLSREIQLGRVSEKSAIEVLNAIESFLVRRAISGIEPTGLHAVFKRLWIDSKADKSPENMTADSVLAAIANKTTVSWPKNEVVRQAVMNRDLYGSKIAKYILTEYDRSLKGDKVPYDCHIEHVLPQTHTPSWQAFTKSEHQTLQHRFANLLPLSQQMNSELSNSAYSIKRGIYREDSVYKSARSFAARYEYWSPELLIERGQELADWFVDRWPHSPHE